MIPEFDLDGRVAIVTGASRSIGRATAKVLAEAGADVVVAGRWEEGLQTVAGEVEATGRRALPVVADVRDAEAVEGIVRSCLEAFGRLDIVVANAGIFQLPLAPAEQVPLEQMDDVIATNLRGVWLTCVSGARAMIEAGGGGSVVIVSSIQGASTIAGTSSYVASKHAVNGLTKSFAVDWAPHGIRVNGVAPGFIERDGNPLADYPDVLAFVESRTPMGRQGQGREVGLAVLYLASPAASYVTGATLLVDGGWETQ
jgi:NAD(P)-dependent dehydrogenase (short-subunit alcohol dehydrogenase family)